MRMDPMNCKQAQAGIALWVGRDLEPRVWERVRRHLSGCDACSEYWLEMQESHSVLQQVNGLPGRQPREPLWPTVRQQIARQQATDPRRRFNGWIPAITVAVLFTALVGFLYKPGASEVEELGDPQVMGPEIAPGPIFPPGFSVEREPLGEPVDLSPHRGRGGPLVRVPSTGHQAPLSPVGNSQPPGY